ncbi:hypothetical protein AA0114_g12465 [Alternaria tenuissima]|uniref:DNA/RNA-binding domain-containing protein n=4 Tax=Alternaria alternata complex TaxID=187734 RepID=A0A4Q4M1H0_9PLEO|nr:hypothetical protein AA0115_g12380 [Alternaria tenuissima]RYN28346.1 hypothetical protein AA0114_g12465 [Alternaria tenuissima]
MDTGEFVHSKFAQALKTQSSANRSHPCPYPEHKGRIFPTAEQLYDHGRIDHRADFEGLTSRQARDKFRELSSKFRSDHSSAATAGDRSAPDIEGLTLDSGKGSRQNSPPSGRKQPAEHEFTIPRGKGPSHVEVVDSEYSRQIPHTVVSDRTRPKPQDARLFGPKQSTKGTPSPYRTTPEPSSEWSVEATKGNQSQSPKHHAPARTTQRFIPKPQQAQRQSGLIELQRYDPRYPGLLLQPDSRPISQEQLASEVKSIYAGLAMVETKCINVDRAQAVAVQESTTKLASDHWQALIALHLPAFEDTWIECLGDLGRYRMAIEDEDVRHRETWAGVARSWYTKAADKNPTVGRLYHHMAILARPNAMQQMYYYSRSLTSAKPFQSARDSILNLFDPIFGRAVAAPTNVSPDDTSFIKAHGFQFEKTRPLKDQQENENALTVGFLSAKPDFIGNLDNQIGRVTAQWKEQGVYIAVTNIAGWFEYGLEESTFRQIFLHQISSKQQDSGQSDFGSKPRSASAADQPNSKPKLNEEEILKALEGYQEEDEKVEPWAKGGMIPHAISITYETFALVLRRIGDKNVLPHVHVMLAFLLSIVPEEPISEKLISDLMEDAPWTELVEFLNTLVKTENQIQSQTQSSTPDIDTLFASSPFPAEGERKDEPPLPEDYLMRGLIWAHNYFPEWWFKREHDEEERYLELASTVKNRQKRILRLARAVSEVGDQPR